MFKILSQIRVDALRELETIFDTTASDCQIVKLQTLFPVMEMSTLKEMTNLKNGNDEYNGPDEPHVNGIISSYIDDLVLDNIDHLIQTYDGIEFISHNDLKELLEKYDYWYEKLFALPNGEYVFGDKEFHSEDLVLLRQRARQFSYFINNKLPMKVLR